MSRLVPTGYWRIVYDSIPKCLPEQYIISPSFTNFHKTTRLKTMTKNNYEKIKVVVIFREKFQKPSDQAKNRLPVIRYGCDRIMMTNKHFNKCSCSHVPYANIFIKWTRDDMSRLWIKITAKNVTFMPFQCISTFTLEILSNNQNYIDP